jgi:myosin heavy subunit
VQKRVNNSFFCIMQNGDRAWVPASLTQARYALPGDLMYGNGRPVWLPVTVQNLETNGSFTLTLDWDGSVKLTAKPKDVLPREVLGMQPSDLLQLSYPNEGSILHLIGDHFRRAKFLCKLGSSFIWINPLYRQSRELSVHRNAISDMATRQQVVFDMYSVAAEASKIVSEGLLNLTVILRGSSGSGKTELSKYIIQYLFYINSPVGNARAVNESPDYERLGHARNPLLFTSQEDNIAKGISAAILLLDAFGGAPTEKNISSSRAIRVSKVAYNMST